ncbi:MAG TPA: hypothetical protein EYP85_09440 [Armatimonadetes bacterium]|nr:hypothetical protein [Armatimonadota bacterium]
MKSKVKIARLPLTIERGDGGFLVHCPLIQGAFAEGDTMTEAIFNCLDGVSMIFTYRREHGEKLLEGGGPAR